MTRERHFQQKISILSTFFCLHFDLIYCSKILILVSFFVFFQFAASAIHRERENRLRAFAANHHANSKNVVVDIDEPRNGPYFDRVNSKNVTALLGKTAYLNCRVKNLGNKTVSFRQRRTFVVRLFYYRYRNEVAYGALRGAEAVEGGYSICVWLCVRIIFVKSSADCSFQCRKKKQSFVVFSFQFFFCSLVVFHFFHFIFVLIVV